MNKKNKSASLTNKNATSKLWQRFLYTHNYLSKSQKVLENKMAQMKKMLAFVKMLRFASEYIRYECFPQSTFSLARFSVPKLTPNFENFLGYKNLQPEVEPLCLDQSLQFL